MGEVRERTFGLVAHLDEDRLTAALNPIMSPLSWDLGHMAAYEDLWLNHRVGGRELLREDLAALYDAFETPRTVRGDLEFLRGEPLLEYMAEVAPVRWRRRLASCTSSSSVTSSSTRRRCCRRWRSPV